ncbi:MAG: hypothetical protein R2880_16800 [Deinococcales bacterium]
MTYHSQAPSTIKHQRLNLWRLGFLPLLALGLFSGFIGVYWDIAWHIDKGRDSFFTPPHNFIYSAMAIVLLMSIFALLRDRRDSPYHLKLGRLRLHPGVLLVALGAALELLFAPADDFWHRLYGPEVSLWAPMHLIGLLALSLASLGAMVTAWLEGHLNPNKQAFFAALSLYFCAIFLGWHMIFLAEYAFGVPVFPMWVHVVFLSALPVLSLWLASHLRPFALSATAVAVIYTLMHLFLLGLLSFVNQQLDWGGATQPLIANVLLAAFLADLLATRSWPLWLKAIAISLGSFVGNWLLFKLSFSLSLTQSAINWHPQALMLGLPFAIVLAILLIYLAEGMAKGLKRYHA